MSEEIQNKEKSSFHILIVDDEQHIRTVFKKILDPEGFLIHTAENGEAAVRLMENEIYDLIIADQRMPYMDGLELLKYSRRNYPETCFMILTGEGDVNSAVQAMKDGADDYITKPLERMRLLNIAHSEMEKQMMKRELKVLRTEVQSKYGLDKLIARSKVMRKLYSLAEKVAESEATILLQGESGTGKELMAKTIHYNSPRRNNPLVAVDCASMPLELLQSELFGHFKGAFTGAISNRRGLFEEARGGTVFLDEIGDVPEALQQSLLRVVQERMIKPVGSDKMVPIDVRIIAATNRNLKGAVEEGRFRKDLYYRLAVITLELPPLRERREDIPALATYFLEQFCAKNGKGSMTISPAAMSYLYSYNWEGNVRELENVLERAVVLAEGDVLTPDLLPKEITEGTSEGEPENKSVSLKHISTIASSSMEKKAITDALKDSNGNKLRAAEMLGISRASLYNKMRSLGLKE